VGDDRQGLRREDRLSALQPKLHNHAPLHWFSARGEPHSVPAKAKRVVTFFPESLAEKIALPIELDGAQILSLVGSEAFTAYLPHPKGPVFMTLIARTFGADQTTRTWDTIKKCALA
jgi:hypothetical protein